MSTPKLGIIGGGQLGILLLQAAKKLCHKLNLSHPCILKKLHDKKYRHEHAHLD